MQFDKFGHNLQKAREEFGLSIQEFADRVGYDQSYIYRLEKGEAKNPSMQFINKVCGIFHVRREFLIEGKGPISLGKDPIPSFLKDHFQRDWKLKGLVSLQKLTDDQLNLASVYFLVQSAKADPYLKPVYKELHDICYTELMRKIDAMEK